VGLSHVLFSDGGIGVGITRMPVMNPRWCEPTTIGAYHHVVYSYTPISVSFEGAGDYVVTPNEVVCQPAGQVYQRTQLAMTCGFASPSHLTQLFRRHFKIPPSQLRRELRDRRRASLPADLRPSDVAGCLRRR
jgi:Bacterial regulatory helix-turn-helix proteins, AraC family